jgi:hypothetical protein
LAKRQNADPAIAARQLAGIRRHFEDPANRAVNAARLRQHIATMSDAERERRREHGRRLAREVLMTPEHQAKCNSPEAKRKAGRSRTNTVLAWCPEAYRPEYRRLVLSNLVRAPEAKRIILDQVARDETRRVAAMTPHERQLERVRNGAKLVEKPDLRTAAPGYTLGGVSSGML